MRPALVPLLEHLPGGVLHAALPTPFPVGPVNCWVLPEQPVTVIDPGMLIPQSLALVEQLLAEAGLRPRDVDQVVVTHGHPDHVGAAAWLAEQARAPIVCGRPELPKLVHGFGGDDRARMRLVLEDLGIPEEVRRVMPEMFEAVAPLVGAPSPSMLRGVSDGDRLLAGGSVLTCLVTPGHAPGHLSLWDPVRRLLFSGDHLLPRITPNPLIEPDESSRSGRRPSLLEYLETLERFESLGADTVLPGHGEPFTDVAQLVAAVRAHHQDRSLLVCELVATMGAPTVYELSQRLFPDLDGMSVVLGVSEAAGHVDLLVARGQVRPLSGTPVRYAAV